MKPVLLALLLCDAIVPGPIRKVNLYGIFDKIYTRDFPARHSQFAIFWKCFFTETGKVEVTIDKPDGMPLLTLDPAMIETAPTTSQGIYTLTGIEFPVPGEYRVRLVYNGTDEISSTGLILEKTQG